MDSFAAFNVNGANHGWLGGQLFIKWGAQKMTTIKPFIRQGGRCRTQNAGFLRSYSVVLFSLSLLFAEMAYGDINSDLRKAAAAGNTAEVEQLLKQGAHVNAATEDGVTVLMTAAGQGHTETVKALINAGADANAKDNRGGTALKFAAEKGHTETVKALIDAGADANAKDNRGGTALKFAAGKGHTEILDILKRAGARQ